MQQEKFDRVTDVGLSMLRAMFAGPVMGLDLGGDSVVYNAYLRGLEVAVVGFLRPDGTTRPVAILVDGDVFDSLRVDHESGRTDADGREQPPQVV